MKETKQIGVMVKETIEILKRQHRLTGIPSFISSLDKISDGFQKQKLYIVAGRPEMGHIALGRCIAKNIALASDAPVGIIAPNESEQQWSIFMLSMMTKQTHCNWKRKMMEMDLDETDLANLEHAADSLQKAKIYFNNTPVISLDGWMMQARAMKKQYDIQLLIAENIEAALSYSDPGFGASTFQEISTAGKRIAEELDIPVLFISDLERGPEIRGMPYRPLLRDLPGRGGLGADADFVMLCHRPEYYKIVEDEEGKTTEHIMELDVVKNTCWLECTIKCKYDNSTFKFEDIVEQDRD